MKPTIRDLEKEVARIQDELLQAKSNLEAARIEACPVHIGDIVENVSREKRKISRLSATYTDVCAYGYKRKADGSWGTRESYIGYMGKEWSTWKVVLP